MKASIKTPADGRGVPMTSYAKDIYTLFTDKHVRGMSKIFDRIRGIGGSVMPPPPPYGDGPWPQEKIDLFEAWVKEGCPP